MVGDADEELGYLIAKVIRSSGNNRDRMLVMFFFLSGKGMCGYCSKQQGLLLCKELWGLLIEHDILGVR